MFVKISFPQEEIVVAAKNATVFIEVVFGLCKYL